MFLASFIDAIRKYARYRSQLTSLNQLDERTLRDIGINPSEIESCVYDRSGDRVRRYHESWPWRARG